MNSSQWDNLDCSTFSLWINRLHLFQVFLVQNSGKGEREESSRIFSRWKEKCLFSYMAPNNKITCTKSINCYCIFHLYYCSSSILSFLLSYGKGLPKSSFHHFFFFFFLLKKPDSTEWTSRIMNFASRTIATTPTPNIYLYGNLLYALNESLSPQESDLTVISLCF